MGKMHGDDKFKYVEKLLCRQLRLHSDQLLKL